MRTGFHGGNRESVRGRSAVTVLLMVLACIGDAGAQVRSDSPARTRRPAATPLRHTIVLTGGMAWPLSKAGIMEFWEGGPAAAVSFHVAVNRSVSLGLSVEVTRFRFSPSRFTSAFPAVPVQETDITWTAISVDGKFSLLPRMRTCPYLGVSAGASRLTEALYRVVIDGARVTYYKVGGATRLTLGLAAGADVYINRSLAFEIEARGSYVHNDPDFGLAVSARGGLRFSF